MSNKAENHMRYRATVGELHESSRVRIFTFTNFADGYRVDDTPRSPFMVLRAKQAAPGDSHPASQWQPFALTVYQQRPDTKSVFMLDGSHIGQLAETEELAAGPTQLGGISKPLYKTMAKLNPRKAILVGAGPTSWLILKLLAVSFSGAEDLVDGALLIMPGKPTREIEDVFAKAKIARTGDGTQPIRHRLCVMTKDPETWQNWAALNQRFDVHTFDGVAGEPMFKTAVREAHRYFDLVADGGDNDDSHAAAGLNAGGAGEGVHATSGARSTAISAYQVALVRSPYTKQLEQHAEPADLTVAVGASGHVDPGAGDSGDEAASDDDDDDDGGNAANEATTGSAAAARAKQSTATGSLPEALPADFTFCGQMDVRMHGMVLDQRRVGNAHGIYALAPDAVEPTPLAGYVGRPAAFDVTAVHVNGHQCLRDPRNFVALPAAKPKHGRLLCAVDAIPPVNHAAVRRCYGCVVIRGRKCALVRSLSDDYAGMRLPHAALESPLTAVETAMRAACLQLDVPPDNFSIRTDMPTVSYYQAETHTVVTLFVAFATYRPPGGAARDEIEEDLTPDDPYDWLTAAQARDELRTAAERDALDDVVRVVRRGHESGVAPNPIEGLGVFGDAGVRPSTVVALVHAPAAASISETTAVAEKLAAAATAQGLTVEVLAPVEGKCPTRRRKATAKLVAERLQGKKDCAVLVPIAPAADLDLAQYELAPAIADKTWAATRLLTAVLPERTPVETCSAAPLVGSMSGATLLSHTLSSLEGCDIALYLGGESPTPSSSWRADDFATITEGVNRTAAVAIGLDAAAAMLKPATNLRALSNAPRRTAESPPQRVAVLQFDRSGPGAVPLFTPRMEATLLDSATAAETLRKCGVVHLSGHVWASTRPDHQAEVTMAATRVTVLKGPRWAMAPGHALRVVVGVTGSDDAAAAAAAGPVDPRLKEYVAEVEALLADLACRDSAEAQAHPGQDRLGWIEGSDDDEADA